MLTYKGYSAKLDVDVEAGILHGRVVDVNDTITFEGRTVDEAKQEFQVSVDRYLEFCRELGQLPDKPFSGKLPFRTNPDIHHTIYLAATKMSKSINAWMEEVLAEAARSTLALDSNSRTSPLKKYEHNQHLAQLEAKLNQLREFVSSRIKDSNPEAIDQFIMQVADALKDPELRELLEEETDVPLATWMRQRSESQSRQSQSSRLSGASVSAKPKKHRNG